MRKKYFVVKSINPVGERKFTVLAASNGKEAIEKHKATVPEDIVLHALRLHWWSYPVPIVSRFLPFTWMEAGIGLVAGLLIGAVLVAAYWAGLRG